MNAAAWECDHSEMRECCEGRGHFACPCGIAWDEGAEGGPFYDDVFYGEEDLAIYRMEG